MQLMVMVIPAGQEIARWCDMTKLCKSLNRFLCRRSSLAMKFSSSTPRRTRPADRESPTSTTMAKRCNMKLRKRTQWPSRSQFRSLMVKRLYRTHWLTGMSFQCIERGRLLKCMRESSLWATWSCIAMARSTERGSSRRCRLSSSRIRNAFCSGHPPWV